MDGRVEEMGRGGEVRGGREGEYYIIIQIQWELI